MVGFEDVESCENEADQNKGSDDPREELSWIGRAHEAICPRFVTFRLYNFLLR